MDPISLKLQAFNNFNDSNDLESLEKNRIKYLGKKGLLNQLMKRVTQLSVAEKAKFGQSANLVKQEIQKSYQLRKQAIFSKTNQSAWLDVTMPGVKPPQGHLHLVTQAIEEIAEIFEKIGFIRVRYPEVEWDFFAFEALNMPKGHPARDEWETLFVEAQPHQKYGKMVLTPQTSNGQVREMFRQEKPPIRMINIAKCYRRQQDISHAIMFHQFEGLVVDKHINITHLKGTMDYFTSNFYGQHRKTRLRPSHFQFTEPSFEVDINCAVCLGKGRVNGKKCRTCKQGWLELGGSGMVHPNVLKAGGIDPKKYSGFAFGWGVERVFMMQSDIKIDDIRMIYDNDIRFLKQF